jgi:hypothetical protein
MKEESKVKQEIKELEGLLNAKREIIRVLKFVDDRFVLNNVMMLLLRAEVGKKKYGTTLERKDLEDKAWLQHLQEELLDAANYIEVLKSK